MNLSFFNFTFQIDTHCKLYIKNLIVTDTTGHGVIIFPLSSVAFMIMPLDQVLTENQEKHLINEDTIERYNRTFRSFALPLIIELKKLQHLNASLLNSEFYFH